jgi:hypothetical protein
MSAGTPDEPILSISAGAVKPPSPKRAGAASGPDTPRAVSGYDSGS